MLETFMTVGLILTTGFLLEYFGFFGKLPPAAASVRPTAARSVLRRRRAQRKPVFKARENLYEISISEMTRLDSDDQVNDLLGSVLAQVGDVAPSSANKNDASRDAVTSHALNGTEEDAGDGLLTTIDLAGILAGNMPVNEIEVFDTALDRVVILQKQDDPALDLSIDTTGDGHTVLRQGSRDLLVIRSMTGGAPIDAIVVSND